MSLVPPTGYLGSWKACFEGSITGNGASNARRTWLGIGLQMMQQLTGINFIFYFGPVFFKQLGTISNVFLMSLVTTLVNMLSTPVSFVLVERLGRRTILIWGAAAMVVMQFIVAILGSTQGKQSAHNPAAVRAMIAFICLNISSFAMTWGPSAWIVIGEIFPLTIRSRGVGLSTASNWFWNCVRSARCCPGSVELTRGMPDHQRHHTVPGCRPDEERQAGLRCLLPLGQPLLRLAGIRLLPRAGNARSLARASRQDARGNNATDLQVRFVLRTLFLGYILGPCTVCITPAEPAC